MIFFVSKCKNLILLFFLFQQKYIPDEYFAYVKPYFDAILQNGYQAYTSILNKMTTSTSEYQEEISENLVEDSPISNAPLDDPQSTISS